MATSNLITPINLKTQKPGSQTGDATTGKAPGSALGNLNVSFNNQDISQVRSAVNELDALRLLARIHPDVSATVSSMVRIANSGIQYKVYGVDNMLDDVGASLLRTILNRMEICNDYSIGYDQRLSIAGVIETLLRSVVMTGACFMELVLDKARLPFSLKPLGVQTITWMQSKAGDGINYKHYPRQITSLGNLELDIPTVFYSSLDFEPYTVYAYSPIEPAINAAVFHSEIVQDIRRVVVKTGHSRLVIKLDHEGLTKSAPLDVRSDAKKLEEWLEGERLSVVQSVENLQPESALVTYSNIEAEYLSSTIGAASDYNGLVQIIDSILATALKVPQSIIGKGDGTNNTASTESLIFLKQAAALHQPVETVLSRALTLAMRLVGYQGYVKAKFNSIDLRPQSELAPYKAMDQARVLELLSLGMITDQQAAEDLGIGVLPQGYTPLSGTMFMQVSGGSQTVNQSTDAARTALSGGGVPKKAGGKDNGKKVVS
jgi:hypothetical protein